MSVCKRVPTLTIIQFFWFLQGLLSLGFSPPVLKVVPSYFGTFTYRKKILAKKKRH